MNKYFNSTQITLVEMTVAGEKGLLSCNTSISTSKCEMCVLRWKVFLAQVFLARVFLAQVFNHKLSLNLYIMSSRNVHRIVLTVRDRR